MILDLEYKLVHPFLEGHRNSIVIDNETAGRPILMHKLTIQPNLHRIIRTNAQDGGFFLGLIDLRTAS